MRFKLFQESNKANWEMTGVIENDTYLRLGISNAFIAAV